MERVVVGVAVGMLFGIGVALVFSEARFQLPKISRTRKVRKPEVNWAAFIEDMASSIRAGLSAPEAMWRAGQRLPVIPALWFSQAEIVWRRSGFVPALNQIAQQCEDVELRQLVDVLLIVQETGSNSLASTLTQLARMARQRRELINEVHGRQAITVNAARVAVAAPWLVLFLTSTRPQTRLAFSTLAGLEVIGVVAIVTALSYLLMKRLAAIYQLGLIS
jgi:tight adherence protein B